MFSLASSAGVSALTYQSIDLSLKHTYYTVNGRNHFTLASRTIYSTCRLPKNVKQPLELQLGLLRPADFAHPRSQSNRMCTLPKTYFHPTHFSHLGGRSFSWRLSFHLSSQQLSLLFSLIMSERKFPGTPCTCFAANASSSDIPHCGESTDTSCNQKYLQSCC